MRGKGACTVCTSAVCRITPACAGKSYRSRTVLRPRWDHPPPAYAGKSKIRRKGRWQHRDHPRVCGEKTQIGQVVHPDWGSPPRMRGKAKEEPYRPCHPGITPRMCGEKSAVPLATPVRVGSPPHVRGKAPFGGFAKVPGGITPACAGKRGAGRMGGTGTQDHPRMCGKSVSWYVMTSSTWDHLRVCGEKAGAAGCRSCREGSPPRMRGKVS